jgi:predicted transposase/invertase (TIGR01784 family)
MLAPRYLDPRNDIAFKKIFGSEANKDVLIHFLNDILGKKDAFSIQDLTFLNTVQLPEIAVQKTSILDVLCTDATGAMFIVEMQVAKVHGFEKRAQFYAAKAYSSQAREGGSYANLKEIIFLAIVDFVMFPDKKGYKSEHVILDKETHAHDLKDFSFTFLELPKFQKTKVEDLTSYEEKWCYFFKHSNEAGDMLKLVESSDPVLKKAYEQLRSYHWSDKELLDYEAVTKVTRDAIAREEQVRLEGIEEGEKKGMEKAMDLVAQRMLAKNQPIESIMEMTGLSAEQIHRL